MARILRLYCLREIVVPACLAIATLVFFMLVVNEAPWGEGERLVFTLVKLFFREDVGPARATSLFLMAIPELLMRVAPMSILVGIVVGVGRMTLDLEIRAMQTCGIHLFSVFFPILLFAGAASATTFWLSYELQPRLLEKAAKEGARLFISEFANLEPGRVYEDLPKEDSGLFLHFGAKDPSQGLMKRAAVVIERGAFDSEEKRKERDREISRRREKLEQLLADGTIDREIHDRMEHELKLARNPDPPMLVFADEARIEADPDAMEIRLELRRGSLHLLDEARADLSLDGESEPEATPDESPAPEEPAPEEPASEEPAPAAEPLPATAADAESEPEAGGESEAPEPPERDYAVIHFERLARSESLEGADEIRDATMRSIPELFAKANDENEKNHRRREARAVAWNRIALSFEALVLALVGLPLAIWIRPTGKSIGIVLAAVVVLGYHLLIGVGYSFIEGGNDLGTLAIMLPNVLFAAGGLELWRRALRS